MNIFHLLLHEGKHLRVFIEFFDDCEIFGASLSGKFETQRESKIYF